jgi:hypothetical protein
VMIGEGAREIGGRISAGAAVKVTGTLRAVRGRLWPSAAIGIEVLASEVSEVAAGAGL